MPRASRHRTHQKYGCYHIISRVAGGNTWFSDEEKEYFLKLLERFSKCFFVDIHSFCIMGNHFHILATELKEESLIASKDDLLDRYRLGFGETAQIPQGTWVDGILEADEDFGVERLRERLGSISRFVQELKQTFTRWFNKRHNRRGYLWGDRFKGVLVSKGEAEAVASAYIDLNPIRAKIKGIMVPEDYRWSSIGLLARSKKRGNALLSPLSYEPCIEHGYDWYRRFVYESGGIDRSTMNKKKGVISIEAIKDIKRRCGRLGIIQKLKYRCLNLSEGIAVGNADFIEHLQRKTKKKYITPRKFIYPDKEKGKQLKNYSTGLCTTRVLKIPRC